MKMKHQKKRWNNDDDVPKDDGTKDDRLLMINDH
jgi:hypothetical protein